MRFKILIICMLLSASTIAFAADRVKNASYANSSDVAQAEKFLDSLPGACSKSYAYASTNGVVNIRIICKGSGQSMDGLITIQNGVVTQVK